MNWNNYVRCFGLFAALGLGSLPGRAQAADDHLTPPRNVLALDEDETHYQASVRRWLLPGTAPRALVQVVVLPSFTPEYSLVIERTGPTAYVLTYRLAQRNIWQASGFGAPPNITLLSPQGTVRQPPTRHAAPDSVAVTTRQVVISPQLAQALADVLSAALAQTRYPVAEPLHIDGTTLVFSLYQPNVGFRSGNSFDPAPASSNLAALNQLASHLRGLLSAQHSAFEQDLLLTEAQHLLTQLASR